ncbi:hypothetical protein [Halalkalicoccus salilacus]|uniref:hypothetical protein n=1 Tax=Halalkalicoccus salilacus TaxID=3117459 RepID=UPI00300EFD78
MAERAAVRPDLIRGDHCLNFERFPVDDDDTGVVNRRAKGMVGEASAGVVVTDRSATDVVIVDWDVLFVLDENRIGVDDNLVDDRKFLVLEIGVDPSNRSCGNEVFEYLVWP